MSTDRFNKAARDGYLDALKEATRKDLNTRDEDGMTPTLWAAFEGNLDALRLIVGRGGDPDKCDNYGNTALHFSSARGHHHCVTFLVNFGVNMWALDIDYHTPKDLAAINNKEEILRFLDVAIAKEEAKDKKKVKSYKEKAQKDAEKRVKEFDKLQKRASKSVEEEQKKLMKRREKMDKKGGLSATPHIISGSGLAGDFPQQQIASQQQPPQHSALSFLSLRKDTRPVQNSGSHSFSELVTNSQKMKGGGLHTGVYKKVQQRKTLNSAKATGSDFKVGDVGDGGKRSVRSLSGLRRDNEVMYVPKFDITAANNGKRGKISGLFENETEEGLSSAGAMGRRLSRGGGGSEPEGEDDDDDDEDNQENPSRLTRSLSQPDYIHQAGIHSSSSSRFNEESSSSRDHHHQSIFERPGFGSVAFRKNMNSTLSNFASFTHHQHHSGSSFGGGGGGGSHHNGNGRTEAVLLEEEDDTDLHRDSIGSASSLDGTSKAQLSHQSGPWDDGDGGGSEEELGSLEVFLAAANLMNYAHIFVREKIDLEALLLLTDEDFKSMGIELGPRRKLLNAIGERQRVMENPGEVIDSRL